jgi:asparagine synthase (glutamine-hydrolysing)
VSGIVGLINGDGAPVDQQLLGRMTAFLAFRGPDARHTWSAGPVGLGHTLLRATRESKDERQPLSFEGEVWVTADARIDARAELVGELRALGREASETLPDVALILHAYHAWGAECVGHLLGDFAFAVWDGRRRRLFCARDPLGIKPFYYAAVGDRTGWVPPTLLFSNTLNCVRLHPGVSDALNDRAVGDFLLFGCNHDPGTTVFADVRRLPPAHTLEWADGALRLSRYWVLPFDREVRFRRLGDYVEEFGRLFRAAVGDRMRADRVSISLSGGLDSSSVAVVAREVAAAQSPPVQLRAGTLVADKLIPDRERHFAGLVAEALDIPIDFQPADGYGLFERWDEPALHKPEPFEGPLAALDADQFRARAAWGRVLLTGNGGDPLQYASPNHMLELLRRGRWGRFAADFCNSLRRGRLPKVGFRARLRRLLGVKRPWQFALPEWLNPDFARRLDLADRLGEINAGQPSPHRTRATSYQALLSCEFVKVFEGCDPGATGCPLEVRHPYLDLRVVNFFLAIPPVPWCDNKDLVRQAMRGRLPEAIRLRPKAHLAGEPVRELLGREEARWVDQFVATEELKRYVDRPAVPPLAGETDLGRIWTNLRPLCLQFWLRHRDAFREGLRREAVAPSPEVATVSGAGR